MTLTPDQLKRIDTRAQRQRYKDTDGEESKLSLYIRIGTSTLYDWQPAIKSTLKEIAFMRVQGAPAGTKVKPRDPSRKTINYDDWCWASEKTLAQRSGCSERSTQRHIAQLKKDGVIEVRSWRDKWGHQHNEYKINEQIIDDNQRPDDGSRARCEWKVRKPNSSWFSKTNQPRKSLENSSGSTAPLQQCSKATRHPVRKPTDTASASHTTSCPSPTRQPVGDPTDELSVEVGVAVGVALDVDGGRRRARTPLRGGVVPIASLSNPKPQNQQQPQPVTLPEPVPLTPDETCAVCGGYYLDCLHKSGTLASPLVAALPKKDSAERKVEHSRGCYGNPCVCYLSLCHESQEYWKTLEKYGLCGYVGQKWYLGVSPDEAIAGYPDIAACIEDLFLKQPPDLIAKLRVLIKPASAATKPQTEVKADKYERYMSGLDEPEEQVQRAAFEIEEDLG